MKHLLKHFKTLTKHPQNAEELKGLILQLAIQGKLTENWRQENLNLESTSELLKRIKLEKQQLIAEKKIKKEKPFDEIKINEYPFQLPKKWSWCRFNDFCEKITQGPNPKYRGDTDEKYRVLKTKDFYDYKIHYEKCEEISETIFTNWKRFELKNNDIIFGLVGKGSTGKCNIFEEQSNKRYIFTRATGLFRILPSIPVLPFLVKQFFNSIYGQMEVERITEGSTGQLVIRTSEIKKLMFPLPPLEEQKAIVAIVNKLFQEVEQLEKVTKTRIQLKEDFVTSALQRLTETENVDQERQFLQTHFTQFFTEKENVKQLRDTILQLAVQGKLTTKWRSQNPNTEPASELLKRIQSEKQKLIAQKKIKKEKPLPQIDNNEEFREIPDSWKVERLGNIGDWGAGATPLRSRHDFYGGKTNWFKSGELNNAVMDYESSEKITDLALEKTSVRLNKPGDVLIAMYGATIGKTGRLKVYGTTNQAVCACTPFSCITSEYLHLLLKGLKQIFLNQGEGGAQPNISRVKIRNQIFALPPLEEQKAIVKQVNSLMALCDSLEEHITNSQTQIEQLMQSCLREVFN